MSILTDAVGSALAASSAVWGFQSVRILRRGPGGLRAVAAKAGINVRLALTCFLLGMNEIFLQRSSTAGWVLLGVVAAVLAWTAVVLVLPRIRRPVRFGPKAPGS
jgi:hypothetical protein